MGKKRKIRVRTGGKLIVNGGTITSNCLSNLWGGVRIDGSGATLATVSDIDLINGAIIKDVDGTAISMFPSKSWPDARNYSNGVIYADRAIFQNCFKAIELIAYQPSNNGSTIKNCEFSQSKHGISNWNGRGIKVIGNRFEGLLRTCINIDGGSMDVTYNNLDSDEENILIYHSEGALRSKIAHNTFRGDGYGVSSFGATTTPNLIYSNTFYNRLASIELDGSNHNDIFSNNILSTANNGINATNSGGLKNYIYENKFGYCYSALYVRENNTGLKFFKNCFDSRSQDVYLYQASLPYVLDDGARYSSTAKAAANCFSHQGKSSYPRDITGSVASTSYYSVNQDWETNCYDLNSSLLGVTNRAANGSGCYLGFRLAKAHENNLPNSLEPPNPAEEKKSTGYELTLDKWVTRFKDAKESKEDNQLRVEENLGREGHKFGNTFASHPVEDEFVLTYANLINQNKLRKADEMLLPPFALSDELSDFVHVQLNYNKWLKNGLYLSDTKIAEIKDLATKKHVYSGYAKAFLYKMTGEVLHQVPVYESDATTDNKMSSGVSNSSSNLINSTSTKSNIAFHNGNNWDMSVIPNPAHSKVNISLPSGVGPGIINIYNGSGKLVYSHNTGDQDFDHVLDAQELENGLYMVTYSNTKQDSPILSSRLIIYKE